MHPRAREIVDGIGSLRALGSPEEYQALFESVYPSEADRRTYMAAKISGAKPSYGHIALATLVKGARCRLVWTSNFDPLAADGCAKVYGGTGQLTTVAIETGSLGRDAIDEGRWPVEGQASRRLPIAPAQEHRGRTARTRCETQSTADR
ncbi:hypothetical protein [Bradyrhizobium sp. 195]|uniref:hypothetical protein n=1 Tax=Bradyrhizobium sp. 195 TaxID=2782662 RepID=UPI0020007386|nr:hypothetical protein [Bradyrhizobium sp. 195]